MITAGIDVGSSAAKAVIFDGKVLSWIVIPTGWNPKEAGTLAFQQALAKAELSSSQVTRIIGTGYGRISLPFIDQKVTEITCHAKGAAYLFPNTRTVIDIGGQDCKVISLNEKGSVLDFVMNDKCAAGTGRFLQVMTGVLDMTLAELGAEAESTATKDSQDSKYSQDRQEGKYSEEDIDRIKPVGRVEPVIINSMCTVFAESEIIGLLAQGVPKAAIASGIINSIANRIKSLTGRVACRDEITFTGGVALNPAICRQLSTELGLHFNIPVEPQIIGALGAAILAQG